MKNIFVASVLVLLLASCGHTNSQKHHDHSNCGSSEKKDCKGGCDTGEKAKSDVKEGQKECEECKKTT